MAKTPLTFGFTVVLTIIPAVSWAQLSSNTLMVTASSSATAQPDQAVFSISVISGLDKSLDDILKALGGSGITGANLVGISAQFAPNPNTTGVPSYTTWDFQLTVPLANIQTENASLISLQNSVSLSFSTLNAQSSTQQFQNCDLPGLVANARAQAQTIAGAAGMSPTSIVSLQGSVSQPASSCSLTATFALGFSPQPEPHTITIVATRVLNPVPDQALIAITVESSLMAGLNDISGALAAAGISGSSFSGVSTLIQSGPTSRSYLEWSFTLATPLATLKDTMAQLGVAQQTISKQNPTLSASFSVQSLQVSPESQPVCPLAGLISDATAQAQKIAAAASLSAGAILSMSSLPSALVPTPAYRSGDFSAISSLIPVWANFEPNPLASNPAAGCSLAVQFQLN